MEDGVVECTDTGVWMEGVDGDVCVCVYSVDIDCVVIGIGGVY
jgi:hypothetical protein